MDPPQVVILSISKTISRSPLLISLSPAAVAPQNALATSKNIEHGHEFPFQNLLHHFTPELYSGRLDRCQLLMQIHLLRIVDLLQP